MLSRCWTMLDIALISKYFEISKSDSKSFHAIASRLKNPKSIIRSLWKHITISVSLKHINIVEGSCTPLAVSFSAEFTNGTLELSSAMHKKISFKSQLFTLYISVTTISYGSIVPIGTFPHCTACCLLCLIWHNDKDFYYNLDIWMTNCRPFLI